MFNASRKKGSGVNPSIHATHTPNSQALISPSDFHACRKSKPKKAPSALICVDASSQASINRDRFVSTNCRLTGNKILVSLNKRLHCTCPYIAIERFRCRHGLKSLGAAPHRKIMRLLRGREREAHTIIFVWANPLDIFQLAWTSLSDRGGLLYRKPS
jgi:hypothetical protein